MSPEIRPKSFGTFEKQASGLKPDLEIRSPSVANRYSTAPFKRSRIGLSELVLYSFLFYCFPSSQKDRHFVSFPEISELYKVTAKSFVCVCVYLKILELKSRNFLLRQYNKS